MLNRFKHSNRNFWLIGLMVLTLAGLQVAQASSLHDHAQHHQVDCVLCHLPVSDDPAIPQINVPEAEAASIRFNLYNTGFHLSACTLAYSSRAPPRI